MTWNLKGEVVYLISRMFKPWFASKLKWKTDVSNSEIQVLRYV